MVDSARTAAFHPIHPPLVRETDLRLLRNIWCVAGLSEELDQDPLGRTYLDEPVLVYRTESGAVVAMDDRCPHRLAPLSRGKVVGETN